MKQSCDSVPTAAPRPVAALLPMALAALLHACDSHRAGSTLDLRSGSAGQASAPAAGSGASGAAAIGGADASTDDGAASGAAAAVAGAAASVDPAGAAGAPSAGVPFYAGSAPNRNQVQPGGLCARLATIQCAAEAHCCFAPGRTLAECERDIRALCSGELYLDQIASNPVSGFDAAATAAAFSELETRSSQCDIGIAAWGLTSAGLRGIFKGTYDPNASCKPPGTSAITDKAAQAAALAACKDIDHYACLPMSLLGDWTCAAKSDSGGSCVTDDNCRPDMYCSNPSMAPLGKCAARLELGTACINGTDCRSLYCKAGACVAAEQQVAFCLK